MKPKVSVCMPVYNCARYLPEAIESVLKQTYVDYEFVIVNDASTDNSLELINRYAERDTRIIVCSNERNLGQAKSLNRCLASARGEYIKFVFSDDTLTTPDALERMVRKLEEDPEIALVASARYSIDQTSKILGVLSEYADDIIRPGKAVITDCLFTLTNKVGEPTAVMFRKKLSSRGFNESYNQNVDWEMWFYLLEQGKFAYIHAPLCSFRTHPDQQTNLNRIKQIHLTEPFALMRDYADKPYIALTACEKQYMLFLPALAVWKASMPYHKITLSDSFLKIRDHCGVCRFVFHYPMYKAYRMYMSAMKRVKRVLSKKPS